MHTDPIIIHVRMDEKIFRRFSLFDAFILRGKWRLPALFALILAAFSAVCFAFAPERDRFLGALLLIIGLVLPAAYVLHFLMQLGGQAARLGLRSPKPVYTLSLSGEGVRITNDMRKEDEVRLAWDQLHGAWRVRGAIYLYAAPQKAFILPDGQASVPAAGLWRFIASSLPAGKAHGKGARKVAR